MCVFVCAHALCRVKHISLTRARCAAAAVEVAPDAQVAIDTAQVAARDAEIARLRSLNARLADAKTLAAKARRPLRPLPACGVPARVAHARPPAAPRRR
jgi:hypothetical protein